MCASAFQYNKDINFSSTAYLKKKDKIWYKIWPKFWSTQIYIKVVFCKFKVYNNLHIKKLTFTND